MAIHEFRSDGVDPGDRGNADDARAHCRTWTASGPGSGTAWPRRGGTRAAPFIAAGMPYESISFGSSSTGASLLVLVVLLGPPFLRDLLKRSTGASFDRYRNGWTVPSFALIGLLVACVSLQTFANVDLAPLVGAVVGFVFTYVYVLWIDQRLAHGEFPAAGRRAPA